MPSTAALVQTIEYVTVETDPSYSRPTTDDSGLEILALRAEWDDLPDRFRDALADLVLADPGDPVRCHRCLAQPVGYCDEIRTPPFSGIGYEVTVWRYVAMVANADGPVSLQCEDCCPDVVPAPA